MLSQKSVQCLTDLEGAFQNLCELLEDKAISDRFNSNFYLLMAQRCLTKEEVVLKIGCTEDEIYLLVNGVHRNVGRKSVIIFAGIASAFGVNPNTLLFVDLREKFDELIRSIEPKYHAIEEKQLEHGSLEEEDPDSRGLQELLKRTIDSLDLSVRTYNCLKKADLQAIADIIVREDSFKPKIGIMSIKNLGRKSRDEIKVVLTELGLTFGMRVENEGGKLVLFRPSGEKITKISQLHRID